MTQFPQPLDVQRVPLAGINLIEASAGTGKTWTICGLYLRLLLEGSLDVRQILVVTFTNAATAELRERIRSRIVAALDHLLGRGPEDGDPFVRDLVARLETAGVRCEDMVARLELARQTFDEAAIFTIHGFCQRALADTWFAVGAPYEMELVPGDQELALEVARDFWRRHVTGAACPPALAAYLVLRKDAPETFAELLARRTGKPLARLVWPAGFEQPQDLSITALEIAYATARATWQGSRETIVQTIAAGRAGLHKGHFTEASLAKSFADWDTYFAQGNPLAPLDAKGSKLDLCRASRLLAGTHKGRVPPQHTFCGEADALFDAWRPLQTRLAHARLVLIARLLDEGMAMLAARKHQKRVLSYDDLLLNLFNALHDPGGAGLAASLLERFPAALIDEFQDTDPVQFGIFASIYKNGSAPVFLVGDPKQAIYSFRNADLHVYLAARELAGARYTLVENQRSTEALITAVNRLFGANGRAFVLDGLEHHDVRPGQKPRKALDDRSPAPPADCVVWTLPTDADGTPIERKAAREAVLAATSGEIARLLREAARGAITFDGRPLAPGDIAVLVRSHRQGAEMREHLRQLGIGSVELSQASVLASPDAGEVERVLLAVRNPAHAGYVKSALATEMLGHDAPAIRAFAEDEAALMAHMARFDAYRTLWLQRGVGVMYRALLTAEGVSARMLKRPDGERRLTNLLHLGERLHDAATLHPAPEALLRWLHAQRKAPQADEAAQLRLESDRHLVKIVTIHKAKGLEYPVVFCPFLWDGQLPTRKDWRDASTYHDRDGHAVVDFRSDDERGDDAAWVKAQIALETMAEAVRLTYVALTRASHRCYLVAGCYAHGPSLSVKQGTHSVLNWLVAGDGMDPGDWPKADRTPAGILGAWSSLAQECARSVTLLPLPGDAPRPMAREAVAAESLVACTPPARIPPAWRISSYSALAFEALHEASAVDHDVRVAAAAPGKPPADLPADDVLHFPRGPLAGECLHAVLERIDFTDPGTWPEAIERALAAAPFHGRADASRHMAMVQGMLGDVLGTVLPGGMRLAEVSPERCLVELEFSLPAPHVTAPGLNALLAARGYDVPLLGFADLQGYLKGFIDLVFEHAGRFYIVDWKSNHLGYSSADYAAPSPERPWWSTVMTCSICSTSVRVASLPRTAHRGIPLRAALRRRALSLRARCAPGRTQADGSPAGSMPTGSTPRLSGHSTAC